MRQATKRVQIRRIAEIIYSFYLVLSDISKCEEKVNMCQAEEAYGNEREKKGADLVSKLMKILLSEKRFEDAERASEDEEYRSKLIKEYKIDV